MTEILVVIALGTRGVALDFHSTEFVKWAAETGLTLRCLIRGNNLLRRFSPFAPVGEKMKKKLTIGAVVAAVLFAASTQVSITSHGESLKNGSTQVVLRKGRLAHLPFLASGEQMCGGKNFLCEGSFAIATRDGDQYLFGLPYIGLVHSLSMLFSFEK
jgi:hypothetical protein